MPIFDGEQVYVADSEVRRAIEGLQPYATVHGVKLYAASEIRKRLAHLINMTQAFAKAQIMLDADYYNYADQDRWTHGKACTIHAVSEAKRQGYKATILDLDKRS